MLAHHSQNNVAGMLHYISDMCHRLRSLPATCLDNNRQVLSIYENTRMQCLVVYGLTLERLPYA